MNFRYQAKVRAIERISVLGDAWRGRKEVHVAKESKFSQPKVRTERYKFKGRVLKAGVAFWVRGYRCLD